MRRLSRDITFANVLRDLGRTAQQGITVATAACRADDDNAAVADRMARDLARRVEAFDGAVALDPRPDLNAGEAAHDAERRDNRAIRQQRIARISRQHPQGA